MWLDLQINADLKRELKTTVNTANTRWQHSHPGDYNNIQINKVGENTFELKKIQQINCHGNQHNVIHESYDFLCKYHN